MCEEDGGHGCSRACETVCDEQCMEGGVSAEEGASGVDGGVGPSAGRAMASGPELQVSEGSGSARRSLTARDDGATSKAQPSGKRSSGRGGTRSTEGSEGAADEEAPAEDEESQEDEESPEEYEESWEDEESPEDDDEAEDEDAEDEETWEDGLQAPDMLDLEEVGWDRDPQDDRWADALRDEMRANLRAQGWLGEFEPMQTNCPLFARKVSREAVPQFAAAAWRCDGLGFAWECLAQGRTGGP